MNKVSNLESVIKPEDNNVDFNILFQARGAYRKS